MKSYERFAEFYDAVMGDRRAAAEQVRVLIRAAKPDAKKVFELGCGTGSILKCLQDAYEVSGLDISGKMLSVARKKIPRSKLFRRDMVDFGIDGRFDVIFCVFDSINHVRRFSDWKKVFAAVRRHLLPGGCFIFDINTPQKLERLIARPPWVHRFGRNLLIIDVTALPSGGSNWNVKCGFRKFWHSDSRNSGILGTGKQGVLQLEMTCSPGGSIEANEPSSLQDAVEDGGGRILVM